MRSPRWRTCSRAPNPLASMITVMSPPFGRRLPRLIAALASCSALAALALPAAATAVTTLKTRTSTLTIYGKPPAKLPGVATKTTVAPTTAGGAAAPSITHVPTTGTVRVPPVGTAPAPAVAGAKAPATPIGSTPTRAPASSAARRGAGLSTAAIVLAALAALLALVCAAWGIARLLAYEPQWTVSARHMIAEAGFRASSTWDEFSDWIRLGH
ncbi:MAG: hypothetical protein JWO23_2706 [Solirubrobacterales bacterium]|nr:hypothetical protein [Solirubrobacterales bacterium]